MLHTSDTVAPKDGEEEHRLGYSGNTSTTQDRDPSIKCTPG